MCVHRTVHNCCTQDPSEQTTRTVCSTDVTQHPWTDDISNNKHSFFNTAAMALQAASNVDVEFRFHVPLQHKTGHFGDVLLSQSLGTVLKKLNLVQLLPPASYAMYKHSAVYAMARCLSVCLSVCHKSVLYQNGWNWFAAQTLHCDALRT